MFCLLNEYLQKKFLRTIQELIWVDISIQVDRIKKLTKNHPCIFYL